MIFSGVHTALITPFTKGGAVDFDRLVELVEFNIAGGVDGIVPVGTTGESPTLAPKEHLKVIEQTQKVVDGRCKVIAGTGANSTAEAIEFTAAAKEFGVDGCLQVTPYYNKPSESGLIQHFSAVADIGVPVVLYNVPGRAGRDIPISVVKELAQHESIVGIKEAGGSVDRVSSILDVCELDVLSGDDALALPMVCVGGTGVISVASNIIPKEMVKLIHAALKGDYAEARALHATYHAFFGDLFMDTNPVPIKAAMAMKGMIEEVYRLPMCVMSNDQKAALRASMTSIGLF